MLNIRDLILLMRRRKDNGCANPKPTPGDSGQTTADQIIHGLLEDMSGQLAQLGRKVDALMATLEQVLQVVTQESGQIDSLVALLAGMKQQLTDALSGATLPPAVQEQVDAIFTQATADVQKIADAINANSPAPQQPPVQEEPPAPEQPPVVS